MGLLQALPFPFSPRARFPFSLPLSSACHADYLPVITHFPFQFIKRSLPTTKSLKRFHRLFSTTKMKNMSAATGLNNTSSSSSEELVPKAEGIAFCAVLSLEAVFIVIGNLLTIVLFAVNKNLRKKSLFLVINTDVGC